MRISILVLVTAALLIGCGKAPEGEKAARSGEHTPEQSAAERVIDDFTGKTAADAGRRAKSTIDAATARRRKDMEEALGE